MKGSGWEVVLMQRLIRLQFDKELLAHYKTHPVTGGGGGGALCLLFIRTLRALHPCMAPKDTTGNGGGPEM